ncbi:hypothetical protein Tco_1505885 [Tanacetum coccineum]
MKGIRSPVMGSLAPIRANLLQPHKSFRDSYSSEASIEKDTKINLIKTEGYEADTSAGDTVIVGIDPMSALIVEEEIVEPAGEDSSYSSALGMTLIVEIEPAQRRLEADQLIAKGQRVSMIERIDSLRLENLKEEFRQVHRDHDDTRGDLEEALAAHEVTRAAHALKTKNQSQNGSDGDNGNSGNRNGGNGNGRNENPNENGRGDRPVARECTYQDFMKCQPLNFKETEGIRTIGTEAAFAMSWRELMKLMTKVFQELTMMCTKMVPEEEDRVEKFIGGLLDNIQRNVIAAEPT